MGATDGEQIETLSGDPTLVLPEFDNPPEDPLPLLKRWLQLADERGVREPRALALATALGSGDEPLSRPPRWGGFRLHPNLVEFWHGSPDRLHRRLLYVKQEGRWTHRRLQP